MPLLLFFRSAAAPQSLLATGRPSFLSPMLAAGSTAVRCKAGHSDKHAGPRTGLRAAGYDVDAAGWSAKLL